jgi:hypothetical protein
VVLEEVDPTTLLVAIGVADAAADQVHQAVSIPIEDAWGGHLVDLQRLVPSHDRPVHGSELRFSRCAVIQTQVEVTGVVVAQQEVQVAIAVPVPCERRRQVPLRKRMPFGVTALGLVPLLGLVVPELVDDDALALGIHELDRLPKALVGTDGDVGRAAEGARNDVEPAVVIEVHELWTHPDASPIVELQILAVGTLQIRLGRVRDRGSAGLAECDGQDAAKVTDDDIE